MTASRKVKKIPQRGTNMAKIKRIRHRQNSPWWLLVIERYMGVPETPSGYSSSPNTQPAFTSKASAKANSSFADGQARPAFTSS